LPLARAAMRRVRNPQLSQRPKQDGKIVPAACGAGKMEVGAGGGAGDGVDVIVRDGKEHHIAIA
jgi:hypothetical protein